MAALRPTSALKPHPRLGSPDILPNLTDGEYEGLVESIRADGIMQPIVVALPEMVILDGHHRWRAAKIIGLKQVPVIFHEFGDEAGQFRLGLSLNLDRRHLTGEQKRNAAALLLKDDPKQSDRSVAAAVGMSHHTVASVRGEMESTGQIAQLETRVGQDGRERKPAPPKPKSTPISERVKRSRKAKPKKPEPKASADDMAASIVASAEAKKTEPKPAPRPEPAKEGPKPAPVNAQACSAMRSLIEIEIPDTDDYDTDLSAAEIESVRALAGFCQRILAAYARRKVAA